MRRTMPGLLVSLCLLFPFAPALSAEEPVEMSQRVQALLDRDDVAGLRALGAEALPSMAWFYEMSEEKDRVRIAKLFYELATPSPEAEKALMRDVRTGNVELRLAVQYALGRVSADPEVIDTLVDTLKNDANPLFRDKAAAALAYEQIHLGRPEKARVFEGLIGALSSENAQVQAVSIQALSILTGQTKGFHPAFPPDRRERSIEMWQRWLEEYKADL